MTALVSYGIITAANIYRFNFYGKITVMVFRNRNFYIFIKTMISFIGESIEYMFTNKDTNTKICIHIILIVNSTD